MVVCGLQGNIIFQLPELDALAVQSSAAGRANIFL
jgi:hypothetical protein